jgi:hypothetical protein
MMFGLFRGRHSGRFDLKAVGDHWQTRTVEPRGEPETISVRELPSGFERKPYGFVALIRPNAVVLPDEFDRWTTATHYALEAKSAALLAVIHRTQKQITWYAYAASREALDAAMQELIAVHPVRWATNTDAGWKEHEGAKALVGSASP